MTHLKIIQNTTNTEQVTSDIIEELYNVSKSNQLDNSSDLQGRLEATNAYDDAINYLVDKYQNLYISVPENNRYIRFEDPNMITYLNYIGVGSNGHITKTQAAAATSVATSQTTFDNVDYKTLVIKFNEFKYFTGITQSLGGWSGSSAGALWFSGWTALEEVDISNIKDLGHNGVYGWQDTFAYCTNLKIVTASSKLEKIGYNAFKNCSNLEDIIGLTGTIMIAGETFSGCSKLKSSNFNNIQFMFNMSQIDMTTTYNSILSSNKLVSSFKDCSSSNFTSITLSTDNTLIPNQTFRGCTNLATVTGASNIMIIGNHAFYGCQSLTTLDLDCSKVKAIGAQAFYNCQSLTGTLDFTSTLEFINTSDDKGIFWSCKNITRITLPNTITVYPDNLFRGSGITSYVVPTSVTSLGKSCFQNCKDMTSFSFQNNQTSATKIPRSFLAQTNSLVQDIIIPEGIVEVDQQAFAESQGITGVDLPSTITTLGSELFTKQTATKTLIIRASTPPTTSTSTLDGSAFKSTSYQTTIYVPYSQDHSVLNTYKNHSYWGQFDNAYNNQILELPQS